MTAFNQSALKRIRFVLVETSHPGNIGAVARAMKTMGLRQLALVNPQQPPGAEAIARAAGADDLLAAATLHDGLTSAITGCRRVVGTSARARSVEWPLVDPGAAARLLLEEARHGEVALIFGRERSGLTNDELAQCQYLAQVPTDPGFSSLNLAAAVQLFAYELRRHCTDAAALAMAAPRDLATAEEMEGFFAHLSRTLVDIGFADPEQSRKLSRRLRRLFHRAQPDRTELNMLRGILSAAQGRKRPDRFSRDRPRT